MKIKLSRDMMTQQIKQKITKSFKDLTEFLAHSDVDVHGEKAINSRERPCIFTKLPRYDHICMQHKFSCTLVPNYVFRTPKDHM